MADEQEEEQRHQGDQESDGQSQSESEQKGSEGKGERRPGDRHRGQQQKAGRQENDGQQKDDRHQNGDRSDRGSDSSLTDVIRRATGELKDLIGLPVEGVVSARRTDNGWTLVVQVRELERVPNTMDILANYEVETSGGGSLSGYQRVLRYSRAQTEER